MADLTLISHIRNGGDVKSISTQIEGMLYAKASQLLEQVKLREAAALLNEADPTPRIWNDEKGNPVVPSPADWLQHYQGIEAAHVRAQLNAAKERLQRWGGESHKDEKHAAAELKNLRTNISQGEKVLRQKETAAAKFNKAREKKFKANSNQIHKIVHGVTHGLLGGSGLAHHLAHGIASAVSKHLQKGGANTTNHK